MDEAEEQEIVKPFPIEIIIILMIVAVANDVAEIFFDLLDFTGVGIAGEAIMEPADLILDFFFTGVFWWKCGFGGAPSIIQYIDDALEIFFIPGRTLSVGAGIWVANHPSSALGRIATTASSLETGGVGGVAGEVEGAAGTLAKEAETTAQGGQKALQGEAASAGVVNENNEATAGGQKRESSVAGSESAEKEGTDGGSPNGGGGENAPENDIFKNPLDNPVGTAGEEAFNPTEDTLQEGKGFTPTEAAQKNEDEPGRGIHLVGSQPPVPNKNNAAKREVTDVRPPENLEETA